MGVVLLACAGKAETSASAADPLVGTWAYSGRVGGAFVQAVMTFGSDETFRLVEEPTPGSFPAGTVSNSCVTTESYLGTYAESVSSGTKTFRWSFESGVANGVSGCEDASLNTAGTAMTDEAVASYREQGYVPPASVSYSVTPNVLVLNPTIIGAVGFDSEITLTRQP